MECNIVVTIYRVVKRGNLSKFGPESFNQYAYVAGVSMMRPEGPSVTKFMNEKGWQYDGEQSLGHCLVKISLPDNVHYGDYKIGNVDILGFYSDYYIKDGMGPTAYIYSRVSPLVEGTDYEGAIDKAIASGIMFSVPQKDGSRKEETAQVVKVSKIYNEKMEENFANIFS